MKEVIKGDQIIPQGCKVQKEEEKGCRLLVSYCINLQACRQSYVVLIVLNKLEGSYIL